MPNINTISLEEFEKGMVKIQEISLDGFASPNDKNLKREAELSIKEWNPEEDESIWDRFWRVFEPDWEIRRARSAVSMTLSRESGLPPSKFEPTTKEAISEGFGTSVTGLLANQKVPEGIPQDAIKRLPAAKRLAMQTATLAGDFPFMVGGSVIGLGGGPEAAVGGAFALPAGLRKVLMDKYEKGEVKDVKDFLGRLWGASYETLKGYAVGATTGAVGKIGGFEGVMGEVATMVTVQSALEGHVPEPQDFLDAAIVIGGLKYATSTASKLRRVYARTGRKPRDVVRDVEEDPIIRSEMMDETVKMPEKYQKMEQEFKLQTQEGRQVEGAENQPRQGVGLFEKQIMGEKLSEQEVKAQAKEIESEKGGLTQKLEGEQEIPLQEGKTVVKTPKEETKVVKPKKPSRAFDSQKHSLRDAVAIEGGIDISQETGGGYTGELARLSEFKRGKVVVKSGKGLSVDDMRMAMIKKGFLDEWTSPEEFMQALEHDLSTEVAFKRVWSKSRDFSADIEKQAQKLAEVEETLTEKVAASVEDEPPPKFGLATRKVKRTPREQPKWSFEDKEQEIAYQRSKGVRRQTIMERVSETLTSIKNKATRTYESLPSSGEFAELKMRLLNLSKGRGIASDRTLRYIQGITADLDQYTYDLFTRKILLDDLAETIKLEKRIPFGFDEKSIASELGRLEAEIKNYPEIAEAVKNRNDLWSAIKDDYIKSMKDIGFNVDNRFKNESYFRHQVLDYATLNTVYGSGKKLKTPVGRSYLKERRGSELDINTDYIQAEHEVMSQMLYDVEIANVIKVIDKSYNIKPKLKGDEIPEGYVKWQPREGNVFYMADSIPSNLSEMLLTGALEKLEISAEDVNKIMAVGGRRREFIIKNEVAETLDNLMPDKSKNIFLKAQRDIIRKWKIWQLISPRRYIKYNIRNLTGDADAAFAGNPSTFKKLPQAFRELYENYATDKPMSENLKSWFDRGGFESTLQVQEMGELNKLRIFQHLQQESGIKNIPLKVWSQYWKTARLSTDFREALLRYSAYLDYIEQMKNNKGRPKNFGASIPDEVMALPTIQDRAFWLSNDLLGAYDKVSVMGRALREYSFPFWSWKEVNFKRYIQMTRNAAADNKMMELIGRKAVGSLAKTSYRAYRIGKFLFLATAFWSFTQAWNNMMFSEEEADLPEEVRFRPHITLGRDENGEVRSFNRIGALGDILEWFGLDVAPQYIDKWMKGKMTLQDIAIDMAKQPVNIIAQGSFPALKIAGETLTRRALFPDVFEPRTIRNRALHIARSFGLENEYNLVFDQPSRPYQESLSNFLLYKYDPGQTAYNYIIHEKVRFMKKLGKYGEGFWITPRGDALYNARLALRYGDKSSAISFMEKYIKLGGKPEGITQSLKRMEPLSGMTNTERDAFLSTLNQDDLKKLMSAYKFYEEISTGQKD